MATFNFDEIQRRVESGPPLFSDSLAHLSPDIIRENLNAKVEAQRWCLGLGEQLKYHTDLSGILISARDNLSVLAGNAGQSGDSGQPEVNYSGTSDWITVARGELGVKEIRGGQSNSRISEYLAAAGLGQGASDEISWCSAFINWVMIRAGYSGSAGKGALSAAAARSWLDWGTETTAGTIGSIVVFTRGAYPKGHVGFCVGYSGNRLSLLGGNQSDAVTITNRSTNGILGWRWPKEGDKKK